MTTPPEPLLLWLQDQARAIKSALLERVKGIRVFLDVDDLADTSRRNPARASLPAQPWPRYPFFALTGCIPP